MIYHHFTFNPILDNPLNCEYLQLNKNLKVVHEKKYSAEDGLNKILSLLNNFHRGDYSVMINNENVLALYFDESGSEARIYYDEKDHNIKITHNVYEKSIIIQLDSDSSLLTLVKQYILESPHDESDNTFDYSLMGIQK